MAAVSTVTIREELASFPGSRWVRPTHREPGNEAREEHNHWCRSIFELNKRIVLSTYITDGQTWSLYPCCACIAQGNWGTFAMQSLYRNMTHPNWESWTCSICSACLQPDRPIFEHLIEEHSPFDHAEDIYELLISQSPDWAHGNGGNGKREIGNGRHQAKSV